MKMIFKKSQGGQFFIKKHSVWSQEDKIQMYSIKS